MALSGVQGGRLFAVASRAVLRVHPHRCGQRGPGSNRDREGRGVGEREERGGEGGIKEEEGRKGGREGEVGL